MSHFLQKNNNGWFLVVVFISLLMVADVLLPWNEDEKPKTEVSEATEEETIEIVDGVNVSTGLIVDEGHELVAAHCSACHSLKLVTQNRSSRQGWKDIIVWMQKTQKLWDLKEAEDPILTYLSKNYGSKKSSRRENLTDIEWYNLED